MHAEHADNCTICFGHWSLAVYAMEDSGKLEDSDSQTSSILRSK